jgi:hypothetical protein
VGIDCVKEKEYKETLFTMFDKFVRLVASGTIPDIHITGATIPVSAETV